VALLLKTPTQAAHAGAALLLLYNFIILTSPKKAIQD
jgi:hypothetical protein